MKNPLRMAFCLIAGAVASLAQDVNEGWVVRGVPDPLPSVESAAMPALPDDPPQRMPEAGAPALGYVATALAAPDAFTLGLQTNVPMSDMAAIAELARGLDFDWTRCYRFVRDNVAHAPYWGIMRGPERTLLDLEGNDADQAFLLLALLRASGHPDAKIAYEPVEEDSEGYLVHGFYMPLYDYAGRYPYNAASWLGVTPAGDDLETRLQVQRKLLSAGRSARFGSANGVPCVVTDHFWVLLPLDGYVYYLDPSVKPTAVAAGRDTAADMAYSRAALLAAAGGTVSATSVADLDAASLCAGLDALCVGLRASWTNANANVSAYLSTRTLVRQTDTRRFHGYLIGATPYDFLSLPASIVNGLRAAVDILHGETLSQCVYLDEIGPRRLWISYEADPPRAYPRAVLRLDDAPIAVEPEGAAYGTDYLGVFISHETTPANSYYWVARGATNVYVLVAGFGGSRPGAMLASATEGLASHLASGAPADSPATTSRALHLAGQQWIAQTDMALDLRNRVLGGDRRHAFCVGVAGRSDAPFLDIKGAASFSSVNTSELDPSTLFGSALEHAVLDQLNGSAAPSVSTVKLLELANASGNPVHFADSNSYASVESALVNYDLDQLDAFWDSVSRGRTLLLPQDAEISLNDWSGGGFIDHGPTPYGTYSTGMIISGGMNGGFGTVDGADVDPWAYVRKTAPTTIRANPAVRQTIQADPVAMPAGAYLDGAADLLLGAGAPLAWTRRYDSRARHAQGDLGRGWTHGFEASVSEVADPGSVFGHGSVEAAIPTVVAMTVVRDLLSAPPPPSAGETARRWMVAALTAQWWTKHLDGATVSVNMGAQSLRFQKTPDGSYAPYPGVTATLSRTNGCYTLAERHGSAYAFDSAGKLAAIADRSGNVTSLSYEGGSLACVSNAFGAFLRISRDAGRISGVVDGAGRAVGYAYDADGCLTAVTDADGKIWTADYDPETFALLSKTDPDGHVVLRNAYNALGQVTNQTSSTGGAWTFGYVASSETWDDDPLGGRLSHRYDEDGRLLSRTARDGAMTDWLYDCHGHVVASMDANGRIDVFRYDGADNLVGTIEGMGPQQRVTGFAYDSDSRPAAITNALGEVTRFAYDSRDRLVLLTIPDGTSVSNAWTAEGLLDAQTLLASDGAPLRRIDWSYNPQGLPVARTATGADLPASGLVETFAYTSAGQLLSTTDANGRATSFSHDGRGNLLTATGPDGGTVTRTYTASGRPQTVVDELGRTTAFAWTPSGKPAAVIHPDGTVSTNLYDAADRLAQSADARGATLAYQRDAAGRILRLASASGSDAFAYDPMGLLLASTNAAGVATQYGYDELYRPVSVLDAAGGLWLAEHDPLDRPVATTDPLGRIRTTSYDVLGRRTAATKPSGATDAFGYDGLGNWSVYTNAEGRVYTMAHDALDRLLSATNALGQQVFANRYDAVGNLTNRADGAGNAVAYAYDALNRLVSRSVDSVTSVETFAYDAVGNLLTASNETATLSFAYDAMDRLTTSVSRVAVPNFQFPVSSFEFPVSYARDAGGLVTNLVFGRAGSPTPPRVSKTYDADGRLASVSDWLGHTWTFAWDGAGKPTGGTAPGGILSTNHYDAAGRLSGWSVGSLAGRSIERDVAGRRIRDTLTAGPMPATRRERHAENAFDAADRLVSAQVRYGSHTNAAVSETYQYDGNGALTNLVSGSNAVFSAAYNPLGQLSSLRLSASARDLSYDPLGNRVVVGDGGAATLWLPDHADPLKRPLVEADAATGEPIRYYLWAPGRLLGFIDAASGVLTVAHCDEQGSVIALTDASGNTLHTACYGPNGQDWGGSAASGTGTNPTSFAWLGGHGVQKAAVSDHLGPLYLTRYRLYASSLNRFVSPDPLGLAGGLNLYAYAEGDPLSYIDPLGLCPEGIWSSAGGFLANTLGNVEDIRNAWELTSGADYGTLWGWMEGFVGTVGMVALSADAAFNFVPGKAVASTAAKTAVKEAIEAGGKALAKDLAEEVAEKAVRESGEHLARNADEVAQAAAKEVGKSADVKKLSKGEIDKLIRSGNHPHDLKLGSQYDLFKDKAGNVMAKPKNGVGPGENLYININDL